LYHSSILIASAAALLQLTDEFDVLQQALADRADIWQRFMLHRAELVRESQDGSP
jgi:hypothetical protein